MPALVRAAWLEGRETRRGRAYNTVGDSGAAKVPGGTTSKPDAARQLVYRLYTVCGWRKWAEDARSVVSSIAGKWRAAIRGQLRKADAQMAHEKVRLRKLAVKDYRGIDDAEVNFTDGPAGRNGMMVLAGPNGSGKTSLLEAALLGMNADSLLPRRASHGRRAIRKGARDYRIIAEFDIDGRDFVTERQAKGAAPKLPRPPVAYFSSSRAQREVGGLPVTAGRPASGADMKGEWNRLWNIKQFLINAKAHHLFRERKTGSQAGVGERFDDVMGRLNQAWARFYPDPPASFTVDEVSEDPNAGFDVFLAAGGNALVPLDSLSGGQQELFAFFGSVISQQLDGAFIVVDEPELHLDHSWHRLLMRSLQEVLPNSQFLVATHSPEVFESAYSFERLFLTPLAAMQPAAETADIGARRNSA